MEAQAPAVPQENSTEPLYYLQTRYKKINSLEKEFSGLENLSIISMLDEKNEIMNELGYITQQALASDTFSLDRSPAFVFDIMENTLNEMRALGNVLYARLNDKEA